MAQPSCSRELVVQRIVLHPNEIAAATEVNLPVDISTLETFSALWERLLPWVASSGAQVSACLRNPIDVGPLTACLDSFQRLQRSLREWEDRLPAKWRPTVISNPQFQDYGSIYLPACLLVFPNMSVSGI